MFCTNCGAKIIEGSKFCTRCGKPVVSVGAPANVEKPPAVSNPTVSAAPAAPTAPAAAPTAPAAPVAPVAAPAAPAAASTAPAAPAAAPAAPAAPASAPSPQTYAGNGPSAAARKPDTKKLLVPGAVVLAVIVVIILALKGSHGGLSSPEKAFDAYMGGYASGDFDLMLKAYPDFRIEHNGGEENLKAAIADDYEFDFGDYVDSYEFIYKATGHTNLTKEDVESVESDINATFGTDVKITDVAEIDYDLTAKNKADGTENTQSFTGGYAVKYKGKWYYFNVF